MAQNSDSSMLDGMRVLDFTRVLAGPLCTMALGDLGANVIKLERPGSGDESRGWGPPFHSNGMSAYYLCANRNKLGATLNLDSPDDLELARQLASEADVVVDNYLPGTLEKKGLDPVDLLKQNDRLIWCSISGFGPQSTRPGYDFVVQAERGWMSITGEPDGAPMKVGVALADVIAGKDATVAILAALAARANGRSRSAVERRIHISLAHSASAALVNVAQNVLVSGSAARRYGNAHPNLVPYQLFATRDRPIVIAVGNDAQWQSCVAALGNPGDFASDESLRTNSGRVQHRERVVSHITSQLLTQDAAYWMRALAAAGVPCGEVKSVAEALADTNASDITGVWPSIPGTVRYPAPALGEHDSIVRRMGWKCFHSL